MSKIEDARQAFIQSIETDYHEFDREGAFQDSVRMESAAKALRLDAEVFASHLSLCSYSISENGGVLGIRDSCTEDAVQSFIDAFTWDVRPEALSFLHEASKGEK